MSELSTEILRDFLHYDPETGVFTWKKQTGNKVKEGSLAGGVNTRGYVHIRIFNKKYKAHRLAWLYVYGRWPQAQIDHVNRIKTDNRIANLREATSYGNSQNRIMARKNTGAVYRSNRDKWESNIIVNKKRIFLGYFPSAELASEAYLKAKRDFHSFND